MFNLQFINEEKVIAFFLILILLSPSIFISLPSTFDSFRGILIVFTGFVFAFLVYFIKSKEESLSGAFLGMFGGIIGIATALFAYIEIDIAETGLPFLGGTPIPWVDNLALFVLLLSLLTIVGLFKAKSHLKVAKNLLFCSGIIIFLPSIISLLLNWPRVSYTYIYLVTSALFIVDGYLYSKEAKSY